MLHRVVAGVLLGPDGILLVHRRSDRHFYPDCWDFPGGHVERGEDELDALVRELNEEIGVAATVTGPPMAHYLEDNLGGSLDLRLWAVTEWSGHPRNLAAEEHDELRWVKPGEWGSLKLAHVSVQQALESLLA